MPNGANESELSGPEKDLEAQNPGQTTGADLTDRGDAKGSSKADASAGKDRNGDPARGG